MLQHFTLFNQIVCRKNVWKRSFWEVRDKLVTFACIIDQASQIDFCLKCWGKTIDWNEQRGRVRRSRWRIWHMLCWCVKYKSSASAIIYLWLAFTNVPNDRELNEQQRESEMFFFMESNEFIGNINWYFYLHPLSFSLLLFSVWCAFREHNFNFYGQRWWWIFIIMKEHTFEVFLKLFWCSISVNGFFGIWICEIFYERLV